MARVYLLTGPSLLDIWGVMRAIQSSDPTLGHPVTVSTDTPEAEPLPPFPVSFLSDEEFDRFLDRGQVVDWHVQRHHARYGTLLGPIGEALNSGVSVLLALDPDTAQVFQQHILPVVRIAVLPPSREAFITKVKGKKMHQPWKNRRIHLASSQFALASRSDYVVTLEDMRQPASEDSIGRAASEALICMRKARAATATLDLLVDLFGYSATRLTRAQVRTLVRRLIGESPRDLVDQLVNDFHGAPLATLSAVQALRSTGNSMTQMHSLAIRGKNVVVKARHANERLLRLLMEDPTRLQNLSAQELEEVVAALLQREGYSIELTRQGPDGGVDIWAAKRDIFGTFSYLVQCKRFASSHLVGAPTIREVFGIVEALGATAGLIATTSYFSPEARRFAQLVRPRLQLSDCMDLSEWLQAADLARAQTI